MISPEHASLMARYNRWQNGSIFKAADALTDAERREDRGAFFSSIHETLSHILWADRIWLSRFGACEAPGGSIKNSTRLYPDWLPMMEARQKMDRIIIEWAQGLDNKALSKDLKWFSGAAQADVTRPVWLLVTHIFNHQTHHRGQVHAMLTSAGVSPEDTDIFLMTDDA